MIKTNKYYMKETKINQQIVVHIRKIGQKEMFLKFKGRNQIWT